MDQTFSQFGLEPAFALDPAELKRRFLRASAAHHPDRFSDPLARADAAQRSAALNEAYRTLLDPAGRARAVLAARGIALEQSDSALPPELLMEMMEVREELEEAVASNDRPTRDRLRDWARQRQAEHHAALAEHFEAEPPDAQAIQKTLNALRYVDRMLEQMPG